MVEKGFYNLLGNSAFLPSTLPPNLKRAVEAQFRYYLTDLYPHTTQPAIPPLWSRVFIHPTDYLEKHKHLQSGAEIYEHQIACTISIFFFFIEGMENSLGTFLHRIPSGVSLFQSNTLASLCLFSMPTATYFCHYLLPVLKVSVSLSPLENLNNIMLAGTPATLQ